MANPARGRRADVEHMNADVQRDCEALQATGHVPDARPSFPPTPRKQRSIRFCLLVGIALGGLIVVLLNLTVAMAFMAWQAAMTPPAEVMATSEWAPSFLWSGAVTGAIGLLVPGLWVGARLWRREERRRVRDATAERYRTYWQERQHVAGALGQGHMTPEDGADAIGRHHLDVAGTRGEVTNQARGRRSPAPVLGAVTRPRHARVLH